MIGKQPLSDQRIFDCLNIDYGIEVIALTFLPLGADINSSVYKAKAFDQSSYFVKLKRGHHHDISVTILTLLHEAGIQQIIPPIKTKHGQLTAEIDDYTLIVYPFVDGENGFSRPLTADQWFTLGKMLKQVHTFNVPSSVQSLVRREAYSAQWREAVRSFYTHMEVKSGCDDIATKLIIFMKEHEASIHRLVDRSEQLGQIIQEKTPEFVLCHSDIHAGNVLINKQGTIYVVDWDEPIMAPKERDLMFIGGGIANVWNIPHEEDFFYKGYGKTEINRTILAYYRHERIVEDIAIYGQALLLTIIEEDDRPEMYKQFKGMFLPLGVVDIAFKTDENLTM
jgi:spectinomycin phosphotransferase